MTGEYVFVGPGELRADDQVCSPLGMSVFVTSTPRPMADGGFSVDCELTLHFYPGEVLKVRRYPVPVDGDADLVGVEVPY